jgi:hypothetical protein
MFLTSKRGFHRRNGTQWVCGTFLWVVLPDAPPPGVEHDPSRLYHPPFALARAFVRSVTMTQSGHFMSGPITVGPYQGWVEGTYGANGLPDDAPTWVWSAGVQVPEDIMNAWAKGEGGHNGGGAEMLELGKWARQHLRELRRAGRLLQAPKAV